MCKLAVNICSVLQNEFIKQLVAVEDPDTMMTSKSLSSFKQRMAELTKASQKAAGLILTEYFAFSPFFLNFRCNYVILAKFKSLGVIHTLKITFYCKKMALD